MMEFLHDRSLIITAAYGKLNAMNAYVAKLANFLSWILKKKNRQP